ncbi:hypothetical protein D9C73_006801 [Collichthys lucidus]|uniref:DUF4592 domain-containing protein n=1 Tax=Collichthys lucidus TaxID=240159 RepID=A0A4U5UDL4_COLLU|nr:hypothetical protein D9C73_006801 [Collichthys lucidus]
MKRRMAPWGAGFGSGCSSDSAAMASGPPDVTVNQEPAEAVEECSGKKKSKFQTFKKLFTRKKKKDPPAVGEDAGLKASQSSDNVSKTSENNTLTRSEKEKGSGSKISLGSKALSHDSVFVSDSSEANEALGASQDSIHGKVKSLQLQLKQAIRLGSPPSLMCVKKTEDGGTMSEDDGLPCSPPEYTTPHTVMNQPQRNSSNSMEGMDSDDDQLSCAATSRAVSPLVVPGDFSQPASPFGCLDNSAAKHKLGLRYKACNKRKPITRLELKAEGDSVVEILNTSITEAPVELEQQKATEVVSDDEPKPKVEKEEDEQGEAEQEQEEKEEEEEEEKPQHSRQSLLRDKEEREETEDESETEQDVSHARDTSSSPELCLSEEEAPDAQPSPSSKPSSRASSLDSPGATPEPPAGPREYLLDPAGVTYGVEEDRAECDLTLREEDDDDDIQEAREEESSFLQEVLSSLKTPLSSCSLGVETEGVVLEIEEEVKEKEGEDVEAEEEGEEVKEEEAELDEPVSYHAAPASSLLSDQTAEEDEEEEVATLSAPACQDVQEEERDEEEEEAEEEEEEELVVERFIQHGQKEEGEKEEVEEVKPEDQNETLTGDAVNQPEEEGREGEESEGEEEAVELEEEPEVEEEGRGKMEEHDEDVEEAKESVEEAEEAIKEEKDNTEEMMEELPGAEGQEVSLQEADEGVDVAFGDVTVCTQRLTKDDETPAELGDQVLVAMHETSSQSFEEEREERVEEDVEINHTVPELDQEDDAEENRPDVGQSDQDVAQEESHHETPSQDSGAITPSKTSTTTLHINLISPSSEKVTSFFQQSPTAANPNSETPSHALAPTVQNTASTEEEEEEEEEEEPSDTVETVEALGEEATPPTCVEETAKQLSSGSDQSKVRFTIAPAWQRSLSVEDVKESSPSSPPACTSSLPEVEATTKKDPEVKAEPASSSKVEVVLSPGRGWNAGITTAKPQSNATTPPSSSKPQTSAAASTEESSVVVEGNPDNPFGVRLRKTSVLHRFSSEEESPEHPTTIEPPAQAPSCKVDAPQPISAKPSISQPVSSKPALPKKPDVHGDSAAKNKRVSVSPVEISKPSVSVEKEVRRALSPTAPVPSQPPKTQSLPCSVLPKPQVPPTSAKPQRSLSPPTPVPVAQKSPSCTNPPSLPKTATSSKSPQAQSTTVTSPPFSSRTAPEKSASRAPGLSSQNPSSQRGMPPPALPQDEPPWMALAKKKAKAWSEMPQIVQ